MLFYSNIFASLSVQMPCYALHQTSLEKKKLTNRFVHWQKSVPYACKRAHTSDKYWNTRLQSLHKHAIWVCRAAASVFLWLSPFTYWRQGGTRARTHKHTHEQPRKTTRTNVHSSGLEAHIMVEIWRSQAQRRVSASSSSGSSSGGVATGLRTRTVERRQRGAWRYPYVVAVVIIAYLLLWNIKVKYFFFFYWASKYDRLYIIIQN